MCLQRALVRGQTPTSTTAFDRWVERLHKSERLETSCYQSTTAFDREEHWGRWLHWGRTGSETRSKRGRVGGGERWPGCPKKPKFKSFVPTFTFWGQKIATSFVYWEVLSVILKPPHEQEASLWPVQLWCDTFPYQLSTCLVGGKLRQFVHVFEWWAW